MDMGWVSWKRAVRSYLKGEMIDTVQMRQHGNALLSTFPRQLMTKGCKVVLTELVNHPSLVDRTDNKRSMLNACLQR